MTNISDILSITHILFDTIWLCQIHVTIIKFRKDQFPTMRTPWQGVMRLSYGQIRQSSPSQCGIPLYLLLSCKSIKVSLITQTMKAQNIHLKSIIQEIYLFSCWEKTVNALDHIVVQNQQCKTDTLWVFLIITVRLPGNQIRLFNYSFKEVESRCHRWNIQALFFKGFKGLICVNQVNFVSCYTLEKQLQRLQRAGTAPTCSLS